MENVRWRGGKKEKHLPCFVFFKATCDQETRTPFSQTIQTFLGNFLFQMDELGVNRVCVEHLKWIVLGVLGLVTGLRVGCVSAQGSGGRPHARQRWLFSHSQRSDLCYLGDSSSQSVLLSHVIHNTGPF